MMKKILLLALCVLLSQFVQALPADDKICSVLAQNLKQDVVQFGSKRELFQQVQNILKSEWSKEYSNLSSADTEFGVSIIKIVDLALNTSSDSATWTANRGRFLAMQYSDIGWSDKLQLTMQTAPVEAIKALTACAETIAKENGVGLFPLLENVASDHSSFVLRVVKASGNGSSKWQLSSFNVLSNAFRRAECLGPKNVDFLDPALKYPRSMDGSVAFNCRVDGTVGATISMSANTNALPSLRVRPVNDELADLRESVLRLQDAVVPQGTIAFFSDLNSCPPGWNPTPSRYLGRFLLPGSANLGIEVGTPIGNTEDAGRAAGAHTHDLLGAYLPNPGKPPKVGDTVPTPANTGLQTGGGMAMYTHPTGLAGGEIPAPFIRVLQCIKGPR